MRNLPLPWYMISNLRKERDGNTSGKTCLFRRDLKPSTPLQRLETLGISEGIFENLEKKRNEGVRNNPGCWGEGCARSATWRTCTARAQLDDTSVIGSATAVLHALPITEGSKDRTCRFLGCNTWVPKGFLILLINLWGWGKTIEKK